MYITSNHQEKVYLYIKTFLNQIPLKTIFLSWSHGCLAVRGFTIYIYMLVFFLLLGGSGGGGVPCVGLTILHSKYINDHSQRLYNI